MLRGGGVAFGPKPRDFSTELPKKVYDLAWRTALSYRFRKGELIIVDNAMEIESPSTRLLDDIFKYQEKLRGRGRNLLVTLNERPLLEYALNTMGRGEQTLTWEEVDVKNLLELSRVIIERDALHNILLAHQEDLTHTSLQPWHSSFVRKSPPTDLEGITGWSEFAKLQLADRQKLDTTRPTIYETVANKRYEHATSLPANHPDRTDLTISAYNLLAEAKELHFQRTTGLPWAEYTAVDADQREATLFPRIQTLAYQIEVKLNHAAEANQTSRTEGEVSEMEAAELEVQSLRIQKEAAILAAQVHEHYAEAQRLAGDEEAADDVLGSASEERVKVDEVNELLLEKRLAHAKLEVRVKGTLGDRAGQKKAQAALERVKAKIEEMEAARLAADEEGLDEPVFVEKK